MSKNEETLELRKRSRQVEEMIPEHKEKQGNNRRQGNPKICGWHGGLRVSNNVSQQEGLGLKDPSVWSLRVLPMSVWTSSRCSSFLPPSKHAC